MAANWSSTTPQAPEGGLNVKWQKDGSGNISAYFLKGAAQTPWTQDIDAAGYSLHDAGSLAFNAEYSDTWRYSSNGPAGLLRILGGNFELLTAPAGAGGAVAGVSRAWYDDGATFVFNHPVVATGGNRPLRIEGATEMNLDFYINNAGVNRKRTRITAMEGAISFQTVDDAYTSSVSQFYLTTTKVLADRPLCVLGNDFYAVGSKGLHLGFDGTSGMVCALNSGVSWQPLYLRGAPINIESQQFGVNIGGAVSSNSSITQVLPRSQSDPGNYGGMNSASYMFFDETTKKLGIKFFEAGVAHRVYWLKEGDQGSGLLLWADYSPLGNPNNFNPGSGGAMTIGTRAVGDVLQFTTDVSWSSAAGINKQIGIRLGAVDTYFATYAPTGAAGANFSATVAILSATQYRIDAVTCAGWTISGVGSVINYTGGLAGLANQVYILFRCTGATNATTRNIQTLYKTN